MKKTIAFCLFLILQHAGQAQKYNNLSYDDLRFKAQKKMTTGIILVSTGPLIAAGGIGSLIYGLVIQDDNNYDYTYDIYGNPVYVNRDNESRNAIIIGASATVTGIGLALMSIHFMNKAHYLRRLARSKFKSTAIDMHLPGIRQPLAGLAAGQCHLTLAIPLGK